MELCYENELEYELIEDFYEKRHLIWYSHLYEFHKNN